MSDYKHVVIDEQKNIILPEELKNHMVQGDHNVKTIVFDCPRYSDGRDLSAMAIYICYIRADKVPGSDKAENITIDPEDSNIIHFEWIPKIDATLSSGILTFLVCAEKADEEGSLENGWHTKLCKDLKIAEGMDCLKAMVDKYPAIITYLITRIDDLEQNAAPGAMPDLTGYATENYVKEYAQPKGSYLTEHQSLSGYAKKATTLAGYGITDGATTEQISQLSSEIENLKGGIAEVAELVGGDA